MAGPDNRSYGLRSSFQPPRSNKAAGFSLMLMYLLVSKLYNPSGEPSSFVSFYASFGRQIYLEIKAFRNRPSRIP